MSYASPRRHRSSRASGLSLPPNFFARAIERLRRPDVLFRISAFIVAVLILILAAVVAEVVKGLVAGSARAVGAHGANLAGTVAKWAIWIFAVLAALEQLQIATAFIQTLEFSPISTSPMIWADSSI